MMKTLFRLTSKIALLFFTLLIFTCEKDDDFVVNKTTIYNKLPYIVSNVGLEDIQNNELLINQLTEIENQTVSNHEVSSKLVYAENYDFYVDTDDGKYLESNDGSYHSYSYPIYRANSSASSLVENLIFSYNIGTNVYDVFISTYTLTHEEREAIANNNYVDLEGKNTLAPLDNFNTDIILNALTVYVDVESGSVTCYDEVYGTDSNTGWNDIIIDYEEVECPWVPTSDNNTGGSDVFSNSGFSDSDFGPPLPDSGNYNYFDPNDTPPASVTTAPVISSFEKERRKKFLISDLSENQRIWFEEQTFNFKSSVFDFLQSNLQNLNTLNNITYDQEDIDFIKDLIENIIAESTEENILVSTQALQITLELANSGNLTNFFTPQYEQILIANLPPNSGLIGILMEYQQHVMRESLSIMMTEYEDGHVFTFWELFKIVVRANKEALHFGLDAAGMTPGAGVFFDVTNAAIYTVEMDWANATLSLGSAIPIAGQWITAAKWSKKVITLSNGSKIYLKVYNLANGTIKFTNRGQLRKVLEITDSAMHAHHIIPYSIGIVDDIHNMTNAQKLIQNAAKSNNVWHINDIYNGIPMPNSLHLSGHSTYTTAIKNKLDDIYINLTDPNNFDEAYEALSTFGAAIKNQMNSFPNNSSGDFVLFINNYIP